MDFDRFKAEVNTSWRAHRNSPALVQWQAYNEGWGEGDPLQANRTMELFAALETEPTGGTGGAGGGTAASPPRRLRLLDDASGGRGFGCEGGWVDPTAAACPTPPKAGSTPTSRYRAPACTRPSEPSCGGGPDPPAGEKSKQRAYVCTYRGARELSGNATPKTEGAT